MVRVRKVLSSWCDLPNAIVAIPASNEEEAIGTCLSALATQRDGYGAPLETGTFGILIYANNCRDDTAALANSFAETSPHPVWVVSARLDADRANAGWARKAAMDLAAAEFEAAGRCDGVILTTDADSTVCPTWISGNIEALAQSADCVAGYIDAIPAEMMRLGPRFVQRGRLEDRYLRLIAEIYARCDPRPHDPWPNHRVSSGASLAVTLAAYRAVGGLPAVALGEDAAFARILEAAGFRVRRPMSITVSTSCRFEGRAQGGAADTMRLRHAVEDAPCDDDIEPASIVVRRALWRGGMRRAIASGVLRDQVWARRLGWTAAAWARMSDRFRSPVFEALWAQVEAESPVLSRRRTLRPADLPREIVRAEAVLRKLRRLSFEAPPTAQGDIRRRPVAYVPEIA